jgi:ubiquinone/menaquinone biosynthesis C-methylase UbiE
MNKTEVNMKENIERPYYGYKIIAYLSGVPIGAGIISIVLAILLTTLGYSAWILVICWALGIFLFFFGTVWYLSVGWFVKPKKIRLFQDNFLKQLATIWDSKGKVIDIGTGNGLAAIEIAKRFPEAQVIGVDIWTKQFAIFGISKSRAEENAKIEKVNARCTFKYGDALNLPFEEGKFQLVVSTLTFHEIPIPDKTVLLKEVIRVLAPGKCFLICDAFGGPYFLKPYKVKDVPELIDKIEQFGVEDVRHKFLKEAGFNLRIPCGLPQGRF